MARIHADWRDKVVEQQDELLLAMRNIDKSLAELVDVSAGYREAS
jgi:hypothetical protein